MLRILPALISVSRHAPPPPPHNHTPASCTPAGAFSPQCVMSPPLTPPHTRPCIMNPCRSIHPADRPAVRDVALELKTLCEKLRSVMRIR